MNATLEKATKTKKYFVKDESLHGVDNDRFNYADIAHVLDETISTNEPPYMNIPPLRSRVSGV